ncbi:hypothetical protein [Rhizobium sp. SL42]|uniref:hypothetical protein n=1 Tax=Rhizobium sp. SL42 TaxID=2806346 RepID=UPI001F166111|nr:hypothetical protein [Rhizobium sp. SL42]UJW73488.1 hypothetical protein IM739_11205 [Rhizobium sp. SL42]
MNDSAQQFLPEMVSGIMSPVDLRVMRDAVHDALLMAHDAGDPLRTVGDIETLGRVVLKLYAAGLVDPAKLADAAGTMTGVGLIHSLR